MSKNTISKVSLALLLGCSLSSLMYAEDSKEARKKQMGAAMMAGAKLLKSLDQNSDGELSRAEIDMASATLRDMDTNGDGKVSSEELGMSSNPMAYGKPEEEGSSGKPQKMMGKARISDVNGDGKVTAEDLPERARPRFAMMDANKDGELDGNEIAVIEQKMRDMMAKGGRGGKGPGGKKAPGQDPLDGPVQPKRPE